MKPPLKNALWNREGQLRNGWWMLVFVALMVASRFVYGPLTRGLSGLGVPVPLEPTSFVFVLLVTWACVRLRREPLASVGFGVNLRWFQELGAGVLLGAGAILAVTGMIWSIGGVRFELDPARSASALLAGLSFFLFVSLLEETLFRGFLFQRLLAGTGVWFAQVSLALLFALSHWSNPGMEGSTQVWGSLGIGLAAVLLGLAYLRTRSLALPVGFHLAWNWTQGHVLGFGVSGQQQSGWLRPHFEGRAEWITGGAFGPEASVLGSVVLLVVIALLWKWRGTQRAPELAPGPVPLSAPQP